MIVVVSIVFYWSLYNIATSQACTYLYTSDWTATFDSHSLYGIYDYSPDEYSCWVIEAPEGQVVYLESESFYLEDYCPDAYSGDRLNIYDGESSFDYLRLTTCGSLGVYHYSSGRYAFVEFITDGSIQASGFRMSYKSVDEDHYSTSYEDDGLGVAVIVGIVIGSLLAFAALIGVIICCVFCIKAMKKKGGKVHTTTPGQPPAYSNQPFYPTQQQSYASVGYANGATMMMPPQASTQGQNKAFALPPPQPVTTHSHPVDAGGIPLPAIYNAPRTSST